MMTRPVSIPHMNEKERRIISEYIENEFGIKMPAIKKQLLEGRLAKRVMACGLASFAEYFEFATRHPGGRDEYLQFADLVSTHETSFFREPKHFDYLAGAVLPSWCRDPRRKLITVLSAACSTGEEAYTLAMVIVQAIQAARRSDLDFIIEGIDLSSRAVAVAKRGVYLEERTRNIPAELRTAYLMRSKDSHKALCRFVPELRGRMLFHEGNLLGDNRLSRTHYDLVFCRNVLIYFEMDTQRQVIDSLLARMDRDSLLFLGHSETMAGTTMGMRSVAHAVYQKN